MKYDTATETQTLEKRNIFSFLIYLCFSEADLEHLLQENGLVG